jgi:hypothetical protein
MTRQNRFVLVAVTMAALLSLLAHWSGRAHGGQTSGFGPNLATQADVSISTVATLVYTPVAQDTSGASACEIIQNTGGTNSARCGDSNVSSTRGFLLSGTNLGSVTICAPGTTIYCLATASTTTIGVTALTR